VVVQWALRVVWNSWLGVSDVSTIDLELHGTSGDTERRGIENIRRRQELHWVIEVEFLDGGTRRDGSLRLSDHHVLWKGRQSGAFIGVQVDVLGMDFKVAFDRGVPRDAQFNIMVLKSNQWERRLPVFTERESEWIESRRGRRRTIWRLARGLSHDGWCDVLGEVGGLFINHLTPDQKFNLFNVGRPLGFGVSSWATTGNVAISEEITLTFEANSRDTTRGWVALEDLAFRGLGKVRVTTVVRSKKADFRLANEMGILSANSNKLGNTTRHFIYIEVLFFYAPKLRWQLYQAVRYP